LIVLKLYIQIPYTRKHDKHVSLTSSSLSQISTNQLINRFQYLFINRITVVLILNTCMASCHTCISTHNLQTHFNLHS